MSSVDVAQLQQRIGIRVRELREAARLSQERLAERAGVQTQTVSRVETGAVNPALGTLAQLAAGLDVALSDLLDERRDLPMAGLGPQEQELLRAFHKLPEERRRLILEVTRAVR